METQESAKLTSEQLQRIDENRAKALARLKKRADISSSDHVESENPSVSSDFVGSASSNIETVNGIANKPCQQIKSDGTPCSSLTVNKLLLDVFGLHVCSRCREGNINFELLTTGDCQTNYLIPADELSWMKCYHKENPISSNWRPMKLYLRQEVMEAAIRRFGSLDAVEQERKRRNELKLQRGLEKTKDIIESSIQEYKNQLHSTHIESKNHVVETKTKSKRQRVGTSSTRKNVEFYSNLAKSLLESDTKQSEK